MERGADVEDNAAPLWPSYHEIYGANPTKRKLIREARDVWFEICGRRYSPEQGLLRELRELMQTQVSGEEFERFQSQVLSRLEVIAAIAAAGIVANSHSTTGYIDPKTHRCLYSTQTRLSYVMLNAITTVNILFTVRPRSDRNAMKGRYHRLSALCTTDLRRRSRVEMYTRPQFTLQESD